MVLPIGHDIKVHNLSLPLQYTPTGPVLSIEKKFLDPIAWLVNSALGGDTQQFIDGLTHGEDVYTEGFFAVRPEPEEVEAKDWVRWRELTGEELGEDVYMVASSFTHEVILPRQTLLLIMQALLKLRAEFPEPPFPWLFCTSPYYLAPANGEQEVVCKLEERATAFKEAQQQNNDKTFHLERTKLLRDLEEAGLFSLQYSEEKQYWLELWGFTTLLDYHRGALTFLNHFRQKRPVVTDYVTTRRSPKETNGSTPSFALEASIKMRSLA